MYGLFLSKAQTEKKGFRYFKFTRYNHSGIPLSSTGGTFSGKAYWVKFWYNPD